MIIEVFEKIVQDIKHNVDFCPSICRSSSGKLVIGYGHDCELNLLSKETAEMILREDLLNCVRDLQNNCPEYNRLIDEKDYVRAAVLVEMCFELGWYGLSSYVKMFEGIRDRDYEKAAIEILTSDYAKLNRVIAKRNSDIMRSGRW